MTVVSRFGVDSRAMVTRIEETKFTVSAAGEFAGQVGKVGFD